MLGVCSSAVNTGFAVNGMAWYQILWCRKFSPEIRVLSCRMHKSDSADNAVPIESDFCQTSDNVMKRVACRDLLSAEASRLCKVSQIHEDLFCYNKTYLVSFGARQYKLSMDVIQNLFTIFKGLPRRRILSLKFISVLITVLYATHVKFYNFKVNFLKLRHCTTCFGLLRPLAGELKLV
jgi:hypothetical protein